MSSANTDDADNVCYEKEAAGLQPLLYCPYASPKALCSTRTKDPLILGHAIAGQSILSHNGIYPVTPQRSRVSKHRANSIAHSNPRYAPRLRSIAQIYSHAPCSA